jgi:hypothetical protein
MIKSSSLAAAIEGFAEDGIPLIKLFLTNDEYEVIDFYTQKNIIFIKQQHQL